MKIVAGAAVAVLLLGGQAVAHPYGACAPTPGETCERWSRALSDPAITAPDRSDQFAAEVLGSATSVFVVAKDVAFDTADPYGSSSQSLVAAYDKATGLPQWTVRNSDRSYLSPHAAALSPDGQVLYVTGASYDGFPVGATDSHVWTAAYDAGSGSVLWTATWEARPDGTDNGNYVVVSPDGAEVYVAGVTTPASGNLDIVTLGYSAMDGRQLWSSTYAGPRAGGQDAVFGLAVNPVQDLVYVTGWSDGVVEYDSDYVTVAYALGHQAGEGFPGRGHGKGVERKRGPAGPAAGEQVWVARYDGLGLGRSERAMALAVAPDGRRLFVTGDSYAGKGGSDYDYATVAYDAATGSEVWQARYAGGRGAFNSPRTLVASDSTVIVTGQASGATSDEGNDAGTVAYDAETGARRWVATVAPVRHDDYGRDLALSPDGAVVYALASDIPIVKYTALTRLTVSAYDVRSGALRWQSELDGGPGNALNGTDLAVSPGGDTVGVLAELKRSANPVGEPSQDVYDLVVTAYEP